VGRGREKLLTPHFKESFAEVESPLLLEFEVEEVSSLLLPIAGFLMISTRVVSPYGPEGGALPLGFIPYDFDSSVPESWG